MVIVHMTLVLASVWLVSASDFGLDEINALVSLQNRHGSTQQLAEESQTTRALLSVRKVAVPSTPEEVEFCPHFCGSAKKQKGRGCCVKTSGESKLVVSSAPARIQCETKNVWCTAGQNPWPGTKGKTLKETKGWDCNNAKGWDLGGATDVVCDLPTSTAAPTAATPTPAPTAVVVSQQFTEPPLAPTPAPTSAPTSAPTPPPAEWASRGPNSWEKKCIGQVFTQSIVAYQYDCEQLAIQRDHPYYQYHAGKGLCVTVVACPPGERIDAEGYAIYRDPLLWPLKKMSQSCTGKTKSIRIAKTQMECQQEAALQNWKFYTWNAYLKKCRVSKKCLNKPAADNFGTYKKA